MGPNGDDGSPVASLWNSQRPQPAVPLKLERRDGGLPGGLQGLHGALCYVAPAQFELGQRTKRGLLGGLFGRGEAMRSVAFGHALDGAAQMTRFEFLGETVVVSSAPAAADYEKAVTRGKEWPAEVEFTFGAVDVAERDSGAVRASVSVERPAAGALPPVPLTTSTSAFIGGLPNSPTPPQQRSTSFFTRSTSYTSFVPTRSLSSYLFGTSSSPTEAPLPALPRVITPSSFNCALGAISAPLQPFLRSSHVSFIAFGTSGTMQAWDAEKPFAALPIDDPNEKWTRLNCPEPKVDNHRGLYSLCLLLPPPNSWTARPKYRITRTDLADELRPVPLAEFEGPASFPWCFALTRNYIIVFGGSAECSLEYPSSPRRSFSFPRSSQPEGFKAPPTLRQSFDILKPVTYTVLAKHTGQLLARLVGRAPGGIPREVLSSTDENGIITMELLVHADLSAHDALALDQLRNPSASDRASPVRIARVTLDPLRGFASEEVLTHASLSCFVPLQFGKSDETRSWVAISHPPWLSPGPHVWEASAFVKVDSDIEVVAKLRLDNAQCVPAGQPVFLDSLGGLVACPVILLSHGQRKQAIVLADKNLDEVARVELPGTVPWLWRGAWIPPDDNAFESPLSASGERKGDGEVKGAEAVEGEVKEGEAVEEGKEKEPEVEQAKREVDEKSAEVETEQVNEQDEQEQVDEQAKEEADEKGEKTAAAQVDEQAEQEQANGEASIDEQEQVKERESIDALPGGV